MKRYLKPAYLPMAVLGVGVLAFLFRLWLFAIGKDAGAYDLINMDGGGSTSLVYFDPQKKTPVFVNRHAGGGQRHVGSNLGIFLRWPTIKQLNQQP